MITDLQFLRPMNGTRQPPATPESPRDSSGPAREKVAIALLAMLAIYFFSYFQRSAIPGTIFNEIQSDLALPASVVVALGAMFTYVYGGMQVFVGLATDRVGGRRALLFGCTFMTIGALLFPFSHSIGMLYASRFITGFGASFMFLSIAKEIDRLFDKRHFVALIGIVTSVGFMGAIAGTLPFQKLVAAFGWRQSLVGIGLLMVLFLAGAFLALRAFTPFHPPAERLSMAPVWEVLRNRRTLPLIVCALINFPIYFIFQSVLGKKFLEDVAGLTPSTASTFVLVMIVCSAGSAFLGGISLRWIGHRRKPAAMAASVLVLVAPLIMLVAVGWQLPVWVFLIAFLAMALSTGCAPASTALMKELNRPEATGVSIAIINGMAYIGAGMASSIAGRVLDRFKEPAVASSGQTIYPVEAYATLFAILVAMGLVSLLVITSVQETRGESGYEPPL